MFSTVKQARAALSHLNPADVRKDAARTVSVGLIAATESRYAAMEEALGSRHAVSRGSDPDAPAKVDLVLYDDSLHAPKGAYTFHTRNPAAAIDAILQDDPALELPLARQFPGFRAHIVDRIVQTIARENALFAAATALPNVMPSFIEIPWVFGEWSTDTAFLTANQVRMAFMIAAACGQDTGFAAQKVQILSIVGGAFGWRAIARELAGKIPLGGGLVAKAAIAFAGTFVVGKSLEALYRGEIPFDRNTKRSMYRDALERGSELAREFAKALAQPRT